MTFRRVRTVPIEPMRCARSELAEPLRVFRAADGFEARIGQRLVERALEIGRRAKPLEWFGLLLGRVLRDERGTHVVADAIVVDPEVDAGVSHVRTTPVSEARTRAAARRDFPDLVIIGWIHGHLAHGARFSSVDVHNQASWREAHSLGVVVDPWSTPEIAVYRGPACELLVERPPGAEAAPDGEPVPRARSVARGPRRVPAAEASPCVDRVVSGMALVVAIGALATASYAVGRTTVAASNATPIPRACEPAPVAREPIAADAAMLTLSSPQDEDASADAGAPAEDAAPQPIDAARRRGSRRRDQ